jgi:hypothetical protein
MYAVREAQRLLIGAAEAARHYCSIRTVPLGPEAWSGQKQSEEEVLLCEGPILANTNTWKER